MRKIVLTVIIALLSTIGYCQDKAEFNAAQKAANWNFKIEDSKVYWQKVFDYPAEDSLKVEDFFDKNPSFKKDGDGYSAQLVMTEYTKEPNMNIPFILHSTADMIFYVQIKDGRYRVTVTNITWKGNVGTVGTITIMQEASLTMQDLMKKSKKLKASGAKHTNICLLNIFNYNSEFNTVKQLDDDF